MYSACKSKESLGASVAKKMCFQRSSERIEGESEWKVIPQSRTGSRETPIAEFVVSSWDDQLPDVIGMASQRATTSIRQKMTVVNKIQDTREQHQRASLDSFTRISGSNRTVIACVSKGQIPLRCLVRSWSQTSSELKFGLSSSLLAAN